MASKTTLFIILNILFCTLVSSTYVPCPPPPAKKHDKKSPSNPKNATCPRDTLKLGVCANLLNIVNVVVGNPPKTPCCTLLQDLASLEAAICLCTAIKANLLGTNLNVPISLSLILNYCGKKAPSSFQCS